MEGAAREAASEPLPRRATFPERAWAAAGELALAAPPSQPTVVSTLDARLQAQLEALAAQTGAGQGAQSSAAIIVVETATRAVRRTRSIGSARPGAGRRLSAGGRALCEPAAGRALAVA